MRTPYQIVADHYAASARRDLPGMLADLADDVQWTEMAGFPCAGTYTSAQQIVDNVFAVLGRDWVGFGFTLERLIDGGETVVALGEYSATNLQTGKAKAFVIAEMLKEERHNAQMTQAQLAEKAGMKKSFISRVENGHADIQLSTLFRLIEQGLNRKLLL